MAQINLYLNICAFYYTDVQVRKYILSSSFFTIFILLVSCKEKNREININANSCILVEDTTYEVPLHFIKDLSYVRYFNLNSGEYIVGLIEVDLKDTLLFKRFNLTTQVSDSMFVYIPKQDNDYSFVEDIFLFPVYPDSILIASPFNIYCINFHKNHLTKVKINRQDNDLTNPFKDRYFYSLSHSQHRLCIVDTNIIISIITDTELSYKNPEVFNLPVFARIFLTPNCPKEILSQTKYPRNYRMGNFYGSTKNNTSPFTTTDGFCNLYYSFAKTHLIYKLNVCSGEITEKTQSSRYIENNFKTMNENDAYNPDKVRIFNIQEPKYFKLLYDSYHNLIYRFVYHSLDLKRNDGLFNTMRNKPFSIQILDTNLYMLNEIPFEGHAYLPEHAFIDASGCLHMTINNYSMGDTSYSFIVQKFRINEK